MKRTIFSIGVLALSALSTFAQTWDFSNEPQVNSTATRYLVDTTSASFSELAGLNQIWDFSMLGGYLDNEREISVTDASPFVDIFPDASYMQFIPGFMNIAYNYDANEDKMAHGYEFELPDFGIVQFIFDNRQKMLQFPLAFGQSFEDNFAGTLVLMDEPNPAEGTSLVKADGSGTLKLANDINYSDVLRIHTQDTIYAEITLTGLPFPTSATIVRQQFDYVKPGTSEYPLFTHATLKIINPLIGTVKISVVLSSENPTFFVGNEHLELSGVSVYPNPSSEEISLSLPMENDHAEVIITNITGSKVFTSENYINKAKIDLSSEPAGVYFVEVLQNGIKHVEKLIKK